MSIAGFPLAVKSTLDKFAAGLAFGQSLNYIDLDDATATADAFKQDSSLVVLEYNQLMEDPRDPLYHGVVHIGARTVQDPANYLIMGLIGQIREAFEVSKRIEVRDYSLVTAGPVVGVLYITKMDILTQQFDLMSGVRLARIDFKATRMG